jgi:hypothetical protein
LNVVDLQDIFSGPIVADVMAAREFVEFIERYGFVRPPDGSTETLGELRMITFSYEQPGPDNQPVTRFFRIPALSLIPLPLLEVKTATFDFGVRIVEAVERPQPVPLRILADEPSPPDQLRWRGMLARGRSADSDETTPDLAPHLQANINVKVAVGQADIPAGIRNLLAVMGENAQVSRAILTVAPADLVFRSAPAERHVDVTAWYERTPGSVPPEVQIFYREDLGIEVFGPEDRLWRSGEVLQTPDSGRLEARVALSGADGEARTIPVLFRTTIENTDAVAELRCFVWGLPQGEHRK